MGFVARWAGTCLFLGLLALACHRSGAAGQPNPPDAASAPTAESQRDASSTQRPQPEQSTERNNAQQPAPDRLPPISGPRELFKLLQMQDSQFAGFSDGHEIGPG